VSAPRAAPGATAAILAVLAVGAAPLRAQDVPPPPLPAGDLAFPDVVERTLANGARVLVVPHHEVPFVTVTLVVPGGSVADPPGREGAAELLAGLLGSGTATRSKADLVDALDVLGAELDASAAEDWITVSLAALTPALPAALELMADVALHPAFPEEELEALRSGMLSALRARQGSPAALASRALTRHLYGSHAYGRLPTPASVAGVERASLVEHHRTRFTPSAALFVVAGDLGADAAVARLEEAFTDWRPAPAGPVVYGDAPGRVQPEVVLVHRPGAVQAEVRVGLLLPRGDAPGWTALSVANQVLGGPSGRLARAMRERGFATGGWSGLTRRPDRGAFTAGTTVRADVTGEAVAALVGLVEELGTRRIPEEELRDTRDFLIGSFPLQIETPQQVASQVVQARLLGLDRDAVETFGERVGALDADAVRAAARAHLRPQEMLVVVVGDALRLRPQLTALGHVRIEDVEGSPLTLADLAPAGPSEVFDASALEPDTLTYHVRIGGTLTGSAVRTLTRPRPGVLRYASRVQAGAQAVSQEVVATDALELVSSRNEISLADGSAVLEARRDGARITGSLDVAGLRRELDVPVPEGVMVSDMVELALWLADLAPGKEIRLPLAVLQAETVAEVLLRVEERTEVSVPAGTFDAFRVEMTGVEEQTFWVRAAPPHVVLRIEARGQPVVLELAGGGPDD
jgi:zinc protease